MTTIAEPAVRQMPETPEWLRVELAVKPEQIDRERGIIRGVILAEECVFKDLRGEFDRQSIRAVVSLAKEKRGGLKSRLGHPSASSDSLGKFLGRFHDVRAATVMREVGKDGDGKPLMKEKLAAKGDLHFDPTALDEPLGGGKPLGVYLMDLAESDSDAFGASLVLKADQQYRLDKQNRRLTDEEGEELPPLWYPTHLHACDCVDDGDATHSFLSADILAGLPDAIVRQGCQLLDAQFAGQGRDVIKARLSAFVDRYLNHRFGDDEPETPEVRTEGASFELKVTTEEDAPPIVQKALAARDEALRVQMWLAENA